jgi:ubiquinone/menaquinone biosynthesis C-methylase UbiE
LYDLAEIANGKAYSGMLSVMRTLIPQSASVLEVAAGTGSISIAASEKASRVLCTDISERMLNVARRKITKAKAKNITAENRSIYDLAEPDSSFDIVIAGQVLHLILEPETAAFEVRDESVLHDVKNMIEIRVKTK